MTLEISTISLTKMRVFFHKSSSTVSYLLVSLLLECTVQHFILLCDLVYSHVKFISQERKSQINMANGTMGFLKYRVGHCIVSILVNDMCPLDSGRCHFIKLLTTSKLNIPTRYACNPRGGRVVQGQMEVAEELANYFTNAATSIAGSTLIITGVLML